MARVEITNLIPDTDYVLQARALKGNASSEWSRAVEFRTIKDVIGPAAVTLLDFRVVVASFVADWEKPLVNTDGTSFDDFRHYIVIVSSGAKSKTFISATPHFELNKDDNIAVFGTYKTTVSIEVYAVDLTGNNGVSATAIATKPAPSPVNSLTFKFVGGTAIAQWVGPMTTTAGTVLQDFADYEVVVASTADATKTMKFYTTEPAFTLTALNQLGAFDSFYGSLSITVRVHDQTDLYSTPVSATAVKPAPKPVTSLVWSSVGSSFIGSWVAPTQDITNQPLTDLDGYEVSVTANSITRNYFLSNPRFELSFADNLKAFNDIPQPTVAISVKARDSARQLSTAVTATATNPIPATPTGLAGTAGYDQIVLKWNAVADTDIKYYEVLQSATAAGTYTSVYQGTDTNYTHTTVSYAQDHFFQVRAIDIFNQASPSSAAAGAFRPKSAYAVNTTAPAVPTGLTAVPLSANGSNPVGLRVAWTAVANPENDLSGYTVRYLKSGSTVYNYVDLPSDVTTSDIEGLTSATAYAVSIRAYDFTQNRSAYSAAVNATTNSAPVIVIPPKTDSVAPASSPTPTVAPLYGALEVKWPAVANADPVTYEVHVSTTSAFATAPATKAGEIDGTFFIIKTLPGTTTALTYGTTYYVKLIAKDFDGSAASGTQASGVTLQIDNGDIAANAVRANSVQAGAISTDKLSIGMGGNNLLVNSSFEHPTEFGFSWANGGNGSITRVPGRRLNTFAVRHTTTGYLPFYQDIVVTAGQKIALSTWIRAAGTSTSTAGLITENIGGAAITEITNSGNVNMTLGALPQNTWIRQWRTFNVTVSGSVRVLVQGTYGGTMTGYIEIDDVMAQEGDVVTAYSPASTELLPGSITGTLIAGNTITTGNISTAGLNANVITANSTFSNNLNVGALFTMAASGEIRSSNFAGITGYSLTTNGLDIRSGTISARALQIQEGANMMPAQYAGFEFAPFFYNTNTISANFPYAIVTTGARFESQAVESDVGGYFHMQAFEIPVEPSTSYILSWYAQIVSGAPVMAPRVRQQPGSVDIAPASQTVASSTAYTRYSQVFTTAANAISLTVYYDITGTGRVRFDGIQLEKQEGGLTTPSQWKPPGLTRIDGGIIRTGEIRSTAFSPVGDTTQPAWSLNTQGNMQINDALVRGKMVVGAANNTGVQIASFNFGGTGNQWAIMGDGSFQMRGGSSTTNSIILDSAGLRGYDTGGVRRFEVSNQGSFFLQNSTGKVTIDNNGIRAINTLGVTTLDIDLNGNATFAGTLAASALIARTFGGDNLLLNSSFENTLNQMTNWAQYNNGPEASTASFSTGRTGGSAYRNTWTVANTSTKGVYYGGPQSRRLGVNYVISWYARASLSVANIQMELRWNNPPTTTTYLTNPFLSATEWKRYSAIITWASGTIDPNIYITVAAAQGGTGWIEIDDVQLEEGDVLTGYKPNSTEILPGTVNGNVIVANTLNADRISTSTLNANNYIQVNGSGGGYTRIGSGSGYTMVSFNSGGTRTFSLDSSGQVYFNGGGTFNGNGSFSGDITAATGTFQGNITGSNIYGVSSVQSNTVRSSNGPGSAYSWALQNDIAYRVWNVNGTQTVTIDMNGSATFNYIVAQNGSFSGNIYGNIFYSRTNLGGDANWIEIGSSGSGDYVDEMRMFTNNLAATLRNPSAYPGSAVISTTRSPGVQGFVYRFDAFDGFHTGGGNLYADGGAAVANIGYFANGVRAGIYYTNNDALYFRPASNSTIEVGGGGVSRIVYSGKTFVINHPSPAKQDKYLVHATIESPTNDVVYRGTGQLAAERPEFTEERVARTTITLPDYFEDLVALEGRTVSITPIVGFCPSPTCNMFLPCNVGAGEVKDGKFIAYNIGGYLHECTRFNWEVKGVRKDIPQFEVEPAKAEYTLNGDGPYTYLTKKV